MGHKELRFESHGMTFHIRGAATRGDQYDMHATIAEDTEIRDGKVLRTSPSRLYPWLIARFVTGWSCSPETDGGKILQELLAQPAEPGEDLVLILGSYILNHTGIAVTQERVELKNA